MAKVMINHDNIFNKQGWGFLLIDRKHNKFPIKFNREVTEIPDESALDFVNDKRVIIEFKDHKKIAEEKKQLVEKMEPVVEEKPPVKKEDNLKERLIAMNAAQQMKELKKFGLTTKELNKLKNGLEKGRVDKLLELMS